MPRQRVPRRGQRPTTGGAQPAKTRRVRLFAAAGIALIAGVIVWQLVPWRSSRHSDGPSQDSGAGPPKSAEASYVGAEICAGCHQDAFKAWRASQHREAMQPADTTSVKGRFDDAQFRYDDVVSRFFQRDGRYWVRTDGPDGKLADFEIKYTFGVDPLQQYLIELPGGRIQALSIAWDTRPKSAGGQRWFHLYPGEHIRHGDELHWTGRQQNWNFMCADCHSTNLRKNYDAASDTFKTTWSEVNVSCEACHGPGSRHVNWAQQATSSSSTAGADNGLTVHLTERRNVTWTIDPATLKPVRSAPRSTSAEIGTCMPCHSRRAQIADGYAAGAPLLDFYEPATLEPRLYYPDGQQREEVYTHGSFVQSRMAHAGVTCSDCHEPHSAALRAPANTLCTGCHTSSRYDAPTHHHHRPASAGAACVECHMPTRTYMQVDPRRDHSLRVPRPDLTLTTGVPNACTGCHANRPATWAATAVRGWLGRDATGFQDFATAFHDADQRRPGAGTSLSAIASSATETSIVRASAIERLGELGAAPDLTTLLRNADPLIRRSAVRVIEQAPRPEWTPLLVPLLADPTRSVRLAAARVLGPSAAQLTGSDLGAFQRASAEALAVARFSADRPESRVAVGVFLSDLGRTSEAESEYRAAIRLGPDFPPGYVNLAELLRRSRTEQEAEQVLREGIARIPQSAELHYALGLSLTRSNRPTEATAALKTASDLAPDISTFSYGYALALNKTGQSAPAIRVLISALARHPGDRDILFALAAFERDAGELAAARQHARQLVERDPNDGEARALEESLRERR
jgi:predicted CXXCH cytochrome family protein